MNLSSSPQQLVYNEIRYVQEDEWYLCRYDWLVKSWTSLIATRAHMQSPEFGSRWTCGLFVAPKEHGRFCDGNVDGSSSLYVYLYLQSHATSLDTDKTYSVCMGIKPSSEMGNEDCVWTKSCAAAWVFPSHTMSRTQAYPIISLHELQQIVPHRLFEEANVTRILDDNNDSFVVDIEIRALRAQGAKRAIATDEVSSLQYEQHVLLDRTPKIHQYESYSSKSYPRMGIGSLDSVM